VDEVWDDLTGQRVRGRFAVAFGSKQAVCRKVIGMSISPDTGATF